MNKAVPEKVEVVVVGAGIIGLSTAFNLAKKGLSVLILERDRIGAGASWTAGGMLAPVAEAKAEEPALVDLALESLNQYPEFIKSIETSSGMKCGFSQVGTLMLALGRDHEQELDHLLDAQLQRGMKSQRLTADEVFDLEPHLSGWVTSGLLAPDDVQVDPRALVHALAAAAVKHGARIVEGATVKSVDSQGNGSHSVTGSFGGHEFSVSCDEVVLAAGSWTSADIESPAKQFRIRPVKGQTLRLRGPNLARHVLRTPDVYVIPRENNEILLGATVEEQGFDDSPTAGGTMDLLRYAWHVLPGIYDHTFVEVSVGFRPTSQDHLPIIGAMDDGVYVATGHYRHGILLAPVTGQLLADLIVDGMQSGLMKPFTPDRLNSTPVAGKVQ